VNRLRQHIKNILVEENQNKKVNLVKQMIYDLFDEVSFIEQSTYDDKPYLKIYFNYDGKAANITSWFSERISDEIMQITGGHIVVCPFWVPKWDFRQSIVDVYINTEVLKYDNFGNVINESSEKNKLKTPIRYFYLNFINEEPIEYKGITLRPTYQQDEDVITWTIENPEDHSFNGELIKELVVNEFREFCSLIGLDFYNLYRQTNIIENMPNGRFYLNKRDKNFIETTLKNKNYLEFEINGSEYMLNFEYKNFGIHINHDIIEFGTSGYFHGVKIESDTGEEKELDYKFIEEMSDRDYDEFREWLFNNFYYEIMTRLRQNPRFYDDRVDMWDFSLQPLNTND
jgi:hypothetical protein